MKVFVAGATGVLGRRTVVQLVAAGFDVTGMARSPQNEEHIRELGATPVAVNLFDAQAVKDAVAGHHIVMNLATAIPTGERSAARSAWEDNHRIRREGSRNLVDAALAADAERYVQESITLLYADGGDGLIDESSPVDPTWVTRSALDAEAHAERFAESGGAGVALRFAMFYGPDSAHITEAAEAARAGIAAELGPAGAYRSSVTTDDAASAVVAALKAPSGVFNVADDEPLRRGDYIEIMAAALGAGPLAPMAMGEEVPPDFSMLFRSHRISNARFKELTGWQPTLPSAREAWPRIANQLQARTG